VVVLTSIVDFVGMWWIFFLKKSSFLSFLSSKGLHCSKGLLALTVMACETPRGRRHAYV